MPRDQLLPRALESLEEIVDHYDAIFCDVWGVLHNGVNKFPQAENALRHATALGRPVVLVTNSPRRACSVFEFLKGIGIGTDAFEAIATSGDVTRTIIAEASRRLFHIGTEAHKELLDGLSVELVDEDRADVVLVTGLFDAENESPDTYGALLRRLADRRVPMICANPDIVAQNGSRMVWCGGALARDYAALGGDVQQAGKPYPPIYDLASSMIGGRKSKRILAIGDGLATDIKGANDYGIDVLLILDGIHAGALGDDLPSIAASLGRKALTAQYAMNNLA